ncbi:MAG: hypothetical protein LUQ50_12855 [Methanospirillum sp.]|uniref:hypothetical protein n=1 Tax=Methanospirillum sp. TaxID=45200 RepID=UPI00237156DF|nr:hypothetical protein [Methanospirillum sp.]MDD1729944.1 hypothetical protein [Methanospirillum sp.]
MKVILLFLVILLIAGAVAISGCTRYADPELKITTNLSKVSDDPASGNITYDVKLTVANVGANNAYKVRVMTILSTPKDLSEYRFTSRNTDAGDIEKGTVRTFTERMTLPATKANYDLITAGTQQPAIETKIMSISANVMG